MTTRFSQSPPIQVTNERPSVEGIVRAAPLLGIAPLLRDRGIEPADILASVGLDPRTLDDGENCIPYWVAGLLLQRCVDVTGCAYFGLLVGQRATLASLGILGEVMRHSPSVHVALRSLILHLHLQTRGGMPTFIVEGETARFGYAIYQPEIFGVAHGYDLVLAFEFNILKALCGSHWLPSEILLSRSKPHDVRPYEQFFRSPLRFDAARPAIVFGKRWLEHPTPEADVPQYLGLLRAITDQEEQRPVDRIDQVRRAIRTAISGGMASESLISQILSIPTRTLRRRLAAEGTTFRTLLEEGYYEFSRQLLTHGEMTTAEIAEALNYSDVSAFTRAFRRWTDLPPAAWRARTRAKSAKND